MRYKVTFIRTRIIKEYDYNDKLVDKIVIDESYEHIVEDIKISELLALKDVYYDEIKIEVY